MTFWKHVLFSIIFLFRNKASWRSVDFVSGRFQVRFDSLTGWVRLWEKNKIEQREEQMESKEP